MEYSKYLVPILLLIICIPARASSSEEALIQGFAKWQTNRVEKIILDEAVFDNTKAPYVQRFFPGGLSEKH